MVSSDAELRWQLRIGQWIWLCGGTSDLDKSGFGWNGVKNGLTGESSQEEGRDSCTLEQ